MCGTLHFFLVFSKVFLAVGLPILGFTVWVTEAFVRLSADILKAKDSRLSSPPLVVGLWRVSGKTDTYWTWQNLIQAALHA